MKLFSMKKCLRKWTLLGPRYSSTATKMMRSACHQLRRVSDLQYEWYHDASALYDSLQCSSGAKGIIPYPSNDGSRQCLVAIILYV